MGFGKSRAREMKEGDIKITLKDVAGVEGGKGGGCRAGGVPCAIQTASVLWEAAFRAVC